MPEEYRWTVLEHYQDLESICVNAEAKSNDFSLIRFLLPKAMIADIR